MTERPALKAFQTFSGQLGRLREARRIGRDDPVELMATLEALEQASGFIVGIPDKVAELLSTLATIAPQVADIAQLKVRVVALEAKVRVLEQGAARNRP